MEFFSLLTILVLLSLFFISVPNKGGPHKNLYSIRNYTCIIPKCNLHFQVSDRYRTIHCLIKNWQNYDHNKGQRLKAQHYRPMFPMKKPPNATHFVKGLFGFQVGRIGNTDGLVLTKADLVVKAVKGRTTMHM